MTKLTALILMAFSLVFYSSTAYAGCEHDNDCKGTRICENGACVYPPDETPPAKAPNSEAPSEPVPPPENPPVDSSTPAIVTADDSLATQTPQTPVPVEPAPVEETQPTNNPPAAPPPVAPAAADTQKPAAAPPEKPPVAASDDVQSTTNAATKETKETPKPSPKGLELFQHGYGEVSGLIGFGTIGRMFLFTDEDNDNVSMKNGVHGGIRLVAYIVSDNIHHGAYLKLDYGDVEVDGISDKLRMLGFGYSLKKFNRSKGQRVYLGFGFDIGLLRTKNEDMANSTIDFENDTFTGLELYPRVQLDIVAFNAGGFKMVVPISLGAYIVPFSVMKLHDNPSIISLFTVIQPAMTIGIAFGG